MKVKIFFFAICSSMCFGTADAALCYYACSLDGGAYQTPILCSMSCKGDITETQTTTKGYQTRTCNVSGTCKYTVIGSGLCEKDPSRE